MPMTKLLHIAASYLPAVLALTGLLGCGGGDQLTSAIDTLQRVRDADSALCHPDGSVVDACTSLAMAVQDADVAVRTAQASKSDADVLVAAEAVARAANLAAHMHPTSP